MRPQSLLSKFACWSQITFLLNWLVSWSNTAISSTLVVCIHLQPEEILQSTKSRATVPILTFDTKNHANIAAHLEVLLDNPPLLLSDTHFPEKRFLACSKIEQLKSWEKYESERRGNKRGKAKNSSLSSSLFTQSCFSKTESSTVVEKGSKVNNFKRLICSCCASKKG